MALRRRWKGQRGSAAVEFAMVLGPLMVILLGTVDWGYYFFIRSVVTHAAREGARAGVIIPNATTSQSAANSTAVLRATQLLTGVGLTATGAVTTCPDGGANSVCVAIDYPVGSVTGFLSAMMPATASVKAVMRLEP